MTAPAFAAPRPAAGAGLYRCQECGVLTPRKRGGPLPSWCPPCRAERNRQGAADRRRRAPAPVPTRTDPAAHLATRAALLRIAVASAAAELGHALHHDAADAALVVRAAIRALGILEAVPTGRG